MNSYEKFYLKEVINASGKMTILGVSKVSEAVLAAQRFGGEIGRASCRERVCQYV